MIKALEVEQAKINGNPRRAGQLAALYSIGTNTDYGCHYGPRNTLDLDRQLYRMGYNEVHFYLTNGDVK